MVSGAKQERSTAQGRRARRGQGQMLGFNTVSGAPPPLQPQNGRLDQGALNLRRAGRRVAQPIDWWISLQTCTLSRQERARHARFVCMCTPRTCARFINLWVHTTRVCVCVRARAALLSEYLALGARPRVYLSRQLKGENTLNKLNKQMPSAWVRVYH